MKNFTNNILKTFASVVMTFLLIGSPVAFAQVQIDFGGDLAGRPGDSFEIPVMVDLGSEEIDNFDFEFSFDTSLVNIDDADIVFGSEVTGVKSTNQPDANRIKLGTFGQSSPITGDGVLLFTISGTFNKVGADTAGVNFTNINIGNALETDPSEPFALTVQVSNTVISLPDIEGNVGQSLEATIGTDDLSSLNIASYEISFSYDTAAVSIDGVNTTNTVSSAGTAALNTSEAGVAKIGWISGQNITSSDTDLLNIELTIKAEASNSPLEFTKVEFFDENGDLAGVIGSDGTVSSTTTVTYAVTFETVMRLESDFDPAAEDVAISGSFAGADGWATPGSDPDYILSQDSNDNLKYTLTVNLEAGDYAYKYFRIDQGTSSFDNGEWDGDPNRTISVSGDTTVTELFGVMPDESVDIADVRELLINGDPVRVTGVITTPDYGFGNGQFFMQDNTGGINVFWEDFGGGNTNTPFVDGLNITLEGDRGSFADQIQITPSSFTENSAGNALPDPVEIASSADWGVDSPYMGQRVKLTNIVLQDDSPWPVDPIGSSSGLTVFAEGNRPAIDGTVFDIRIDRGESDFDGSTRPEGAFNLAGVMGRFDTNAQLLPFFSSELETTPTNNEDDVSSLPEEFALSNNYPNPFNPTTNINYSVPEASFVTLEVYNTLGQKVRTLVNSNVPAGTYTVTFDAANLTSGMYFLRIKAGSFTDIKKMTLLK